MFIFSTFWAIKVNINTQRRDNMNYGAKAAAEDMKLSLEKMLTYAIQDEYLAREEYDLAIKSLGEVKPFPNIINSEVNHIDWLKNLFAKYQYSIPEDSASQYLHSPKDLITALEYGVDAEIENINMYDRFLKEALPEDVIPVFTKLRDASKGHLFVLKKALSEL
jgi:hypothetical protein